jgi:hypothetical protein
LTSRQKKSIEASGSRSERVVAAREAFVVTQKSMRVVDLVFVDETGVTSRDTEGWMGHLGYLIEGGSS